VASITGTARPANSVHIVFDLEWHVVVDDKHNVGDIETTTRHICRNQDSTLIALSELFEDQVSLLLCLITVD